MLISKLLASTAIAIGLFASAQANATDVIAWSPYVGWVPAHVMQETGILAKNAKKFGADVRIEYVGSYVDSITLYANKKYAGVTVTPMDVLSIAGVSNRKSEAIIVGDTSNGNDGFALKGYSSLAELKGQEVHMVEFSVSDYLFSRCLQKYGNGLTRKDFTIVNVTDAEIPGIVESNAKAAVVTWKPMLSSVVDSDAKVICSSAEFPGEIVDMIVVGEEVSPATRKALVTSWYEVLDLIKKGDPKVLQIMAEKSETTVDGIKSQLATTNMFYTPAEAVEFVGKNSTVLTTEDVTKYSFSIGMYGDVKNPTDLGIKFANGSIYGNESHTMLTFDLSLTKALAEGKLK
jgi:NitT/TauT family transport system substrate-binding protein